LGLSEFDEKGNKGIGFWSTATPEEMKKRREIDGLAIILSCNKRDSPCMYVVLSIGKPLHMAMKNH
jgi:hypothetical protein